MLLALSVLLSLTLPAMAANASGATIDTGATGSIELFKYDFTKAAADGVWNAESYVSTGVRDQNGVETVLGNNTLVNDLGNGEQQYGYAIKGVEFSYLKVAEIQQYTESNDGIQRGNRLLPVLYPH